MVETPSKTQILLARLVIVLLIAFTAAGVFWYGLSEEVRHRVWHQLIERPDGPMTFRFILQPIMAAIAALRDGVKDARTRRSPYFWTLLTNPFEARSSPVRGTDLHCAGHFTGAVHGRHLPVDRAQDILSRRSGDRCGRARLFPIPAIARPHRSPRALAD